MWDKLLRWLNGAGASSEASVSALTFTNRVPDTIVHLGDGRKLAFGESAEVTAELLSKLAKHNEQAPS